MRPGTLYLVPNALGGDARDVMAPMARERIHRLRYFLAENPRNARALLKSLAHPVPLREIRIERLDENTRAQDVAAMMEPLLHGEDAGLVSEAGIPAVADPGAGLVRLAHARGIRVVPLPGPSSIVLALSASGLEGQRFAFHGYLPVKEPQRSAVIRELERRSRAGRETEAFIEAPYRNMALLAALLSACRADTLLCVATELTQAGETVRTLRVGEWRDEKPALDRRPSVFLLLAAPGRED